MTPQTESNLKRTINDLYFDIEYLCEQRLISEKIQQRAIDKKIELFRKVVDDFENLIKIDSKLITTVDITNNNN